MLFSRKKLEMPVPQSALAGRPNPIPTASKHFVSGRAIKGPYPEGSQVAYFALGCYWGAEKVFWSATGVWVTSVGNMGGFTPNPTYEEVCTGLTGHAETVKVVYDPTKTSYEALLKAFWEAHDPTQGMRQGNDVGTQYRSAIYWTSEAQRQAAEASKALYQKALTQRGLGAISTEIAPAGEFYYAEEYHQQYLAKNPYGYCGLGGTGVAAE
jgi:peptide-methionine (S)-S-oxide reductase